MAKVVYVDWRDRVEEPEIIGVYETGSDAYQARDNKENELIKEGYDTDEEVRVWIEDIEITRNAVRERVLNDIKPYLDFGEHKDLAAFTVGAEYFTYDDKTNTDLEADFEEIVAVVEKEWLFKHMQKGGTKNPLDYLQNEYVWDDSYEWFINAKALGKVVTIEFN